MGARCSSKTHVLLIVQARQATGDYYDPFAEADRHDAARRTPTLGGVGARGGAIATGQLGTSHASPHAPQTLALPAPAAAGALPSLVFPARKAEAACS